MINMQVIGSLVARDFVEGGPRIWDLVPSENPSEELIASEKETDKGYDAWASSIVGEDKLSKFQYKTGDKPTLDPRRLRLSDDDKAGVKGISEATGFSRTTVHTFYALSLSSNLVNDMKDFVNKMVGEPTQTYGNIKNRLNKEEGAKILSTLA